MARVSARSRAGRLNIQPLSSERLKISSSGCFLLQHRAEQLDRGAPRRQADLRVALALASARLFVGSDHAVVYRA